MSLGIIKLLSREKHQLWGLLTVEYPQLDVVLSLPECSYSGRVHVLVYGCRKLLDIKASLIESEVLRSRVNEIVTLLDLMIFLDANHGGRVFGFLDPEWPMDGLIEGTWRILNRLASDCCAYAQVHQPDLFSEKEASLREIVDNAELLRF